MYLDYDWYKIVADHNRMFFVTRPIGLVRIAGTQERDFYCISTAQG
jgi:hypothetical protein